MDSICPTVFLDCELSTTKKAVYGDNNAEQVLDCLQCIAIIYGEQIILLQYITHIKELVCLHYCVKLYCKSEYN